MMFISFILFLGNFHCATVESLNILGVFTYRGRSQFFVFEKYLQKLAEKGHNLTVISHFPRDEVISNYHDLSLADNFNIPAKLFKIDDCSYSRMLNGIDYVITSGVLDCEVLLQNESVQELWKSKRKFDLVVMHYFYNDCALALAYKLGAPVIGLTANDLMPWHYDVFGIPFNPNHSPLYYTKDFTSTLYERVEKTILYYIYNWKYRNAQKVNQAIVSKYLKDVPPIEDLTRRIKLLLLYQNFVQTGPRLLPSNVIEVGGYHVMPPKPLSTDLLKFINESKHGVIYISFGTLLKESSLQKHKMEAIINALAELPQRVVWKWNAEEFPVRLKNIYASKWVPQNDLLAHPNVLAFFSHGGLLSVTEAIFHKVPIIAMPVYGDQPSNAANLEISGFGVQISIKDLTKENLLNKFKTVLNPDFRARVKNLSKAYRDRPVSAMDSAIFWTEFAAQHNLTLRSHISDEPLYQYLCLDIIAVIVTIVIICLLMTIKLLHLIYLLARNINNVQMKSKKH